MTPSDQELGALPWQRVVPPLWWPAAGRHVVADRHLPDGTRQHLVSGSVAPGLVIANAQVIGEDDVPDAQFSDQFSHLSKSEVVADSKMARYKLTEADVLRENGHAFVDVSKLGLSHPGKACLACGIMRRADGQNKPCKGHVGVALR